MTDSPQQNLPDGNPPHCGDNISSEMFRAVADCTYDWESWHAPDGHLIWVNSAVQRLTGYSPEECLAMDDYPLRMVSDKDRDRISVAIEDAKGGTSCNDLEFQSVHRNGEQRWMAVSWQPMYDATRNYLGVRTSVRDITERNQLREQLRLHTEHLEQLVQERTARIGELERHRRQMEKLAALGQLAAGVAHEVNNPLAGIRNAFALIKADITPEDEHYELLELIDSEIERISTITHQMYQLYRRNPQAANEFQIERTVGEIATLLEGVVRKHQVELKVESVGKPLPVFLPEGEVKQILYNLIRNAVQASPVNQSVTIRIERTRREVRLDVIDSGEGIPEDVLPHIFDPFFTTKVGEPKGGMGLGLSVSRSLIEAMGGSIEVDSQLGRGSRFTAIFPARQTATTDSNNV